jgi:putative membrane protein
MSLRHHFSEAEQERIKQAVRKAEARISGEIIPVLVEKSGYYTIAHYKASLFTAMATFLILVIIHRLFPEASVDDPLVLFVLVLIMGAIGGIAPHFSNGIRRLFITQRHMDHATRQRATSAFLEQEVFNTRHRTGIMIFISLLEEEVIIIGDRGISKVVEQKEWDKIVMKLQQMWRSGKLTDGLEETIASCSELLLEKGFKRTPDDVNELRDDVRFD